MRSRIERKKKQQENSNRRSMQKVLLVMAVSGMGGAVLGLGAMKIGTERAREFLVRILEWYGVYAAGVMLMNKVWMGAILISILGELFFQTGVLAILISGIGAMIQNFRYSRSALKVSGK